MFPKCLFKAVENALRGSRSRTSELRRGPPRCTATESGEAPRRCAGQTASMTDPPDDPTGVRLPTPAQVAQPLVDALTARQTSLRRSVFVALDGRSGAGKSTLAAGLAEACRTLGVTVTVIGGDDFNAGGTAECWDQRSPARNADQVIDWRRQRRVLDDLRLHGNASWYPFDWEAPD